MILRQQQVRIAEDHVVLGFPRREPRAGAVEKIAGGGVPNYSLAPSPKSALVR
jgi:hypothetical protein